ncbi:MAG: hypothetical protein P1U63_11250 [Coxiellaceae bacterium]|nr:hypothetical protein [Coxiellaceae bacterium]
MKWKMAAVSLIEVLVALAVLSIGMVALMKFQANILTDRVISAQQAEALSLARGLMSETRHNQNLFLTEYIGGPNYGEPGTSSTSHISGTTTYTLNRVIVKNATPEYKQITVTVSWTDPKGTSRNVVIGSKIASVDPNKVGEVMTEL